MADLVVKAKRIGMEPGDYARRLIEDALAFQRQAEESSFAQIMGPVRDAAAVVEDSRIIEVVETARAKHHAGLRRKKR